MAYLSLHISEIPRTERAGLWRSWFTGLVVGLVGLSSISGLAWWIFY
jgi:hypothetical protein